jgi:glucosamine--fructose-6-phosphate aminotransferase (isomerizing)
LTHTTVNRNCKERADDMSEPYHMIEYIRENPAALRRTLEGNEEALQIIVDRVQKDELRRVVVLGIGSSYTASVMAAPAFRYHCSLPTHILPATEIGYYEQRLVDKHTLVVVVSRSGEREWVVNALKRAVERGAFGVAMTGVEDSLLAQNGQLVLHTGEGPEITFPKTKSVIACAGLLMRLALALAEPDDGEAAERLRALRAMPDAIKRTVETIEPAIKGLVPAIKGYEPVVVVGTGSNYGVALEATVKIQETAYVATQGDDTGDLLHGALGALGANWLVIPLVTASDLQLSREALAIVGKFHARRLSIVEPGLDLEGVSEDVLVLPQEIDPLLAGLAYLPPLQLMTYYWTLAKGMNPDEPSAMRTVLDAILPPGREEPELR